MRNTCKPIRKNQHVGEFTGPGKPTPFEKLEHESEQKNIQPYHGGWFV